MASPVLLEVRARSTSPTGCGARSSSHASPTNVAGRLDPGVGDAVPADPERRPAASCVVVARAPPAALDRPLRRVSTPARTPRRSHGTLLYGEPVDRRRSRRPVGPRADRLRGRRAATAVARGRVVAVHRQPGVGPARARRAARWCPSRFVVEPRARPAGGRRARRALRPTSTDGAADAHRRLHHLPAMVDGLRRPEPARPGPGAGPARHPGPRPAARRPPTSTARSTTRPSAVAPAWSSSPSRVFDRGRGRRPAPPAAAARPRRAHARPGLRPRAGRHRRVLAAVRPLRGRRRAGAARTWSTASCRSATTCSPAARWRPWSCSRRSAASCPGSWATTRRPARSRSRRRPAGCSSTRSTPSRPSSGAWPSPRCCARVTTAASPGGGGPRPCAARSARRPDLVDARGGLTAEDEALLAEFPDSPAPADRRLTRTGRPARRPGRCALAGGGPRCVSFGVPRARTGARRREPDGGFPTAVDTPPRSTSP